MFILIEVVEYLQILVEGKVDGEYFGLAVPFCFWFILMDWLRELSQQFTMVSSLCYQYNTNYLLVLCFQCQGLTGNIQLNF